VLGKAFFWEQQLGSDGMACASCHFHAGADSRLKNQLSPGLRQVPPDHTFQQTTSGGQGGPNYTLKPSAPNDSGEPPFTNRGDSPFHRLANILNRNSAVQFDTNDVASSSGTFEGSLEQVRSEQADKCDHSVLDEFTILGLHTRKVEPRNTPTTINAALNFRNFWDGRANNVFNGVDPFGRRNKAARVLDNVSGNVVAVQIEIHNSSAASQAVGPPLSDLEMSCAGRSFKDIAQKLLNRRALQDQDVSPTDSVLGSSRHASGKGLTKTYKTLIQEAFQPRWRNSPGNVDPKYSQMELNFSLFWGLAVQAYEQTLISDDAPFDKWVKAGGNPSIVGLSAVIVPGLGDQEKRGLDLFQGKGFCVNCHRSAEFTGAATRLQPEHQEEGLVERMIMGDGNVALYDNAFYNIGVRATREDLGVGGNDPFGNPLSFTRQFNQNQLIDPFQVNPCTFDVDPCVQPTLPARVAVDGAFKTPSLRNVSLTQPYFHNGGQWTLEQVVTFYNRGGDRQGQDAADTTGFNGVPSNLDADIRTLELTAAEKADLVAFLRNALTDKRVACEQAPFDHPSLKVPNGHVGNELVVQEGVGNGKGKAVDEFLLIPAVGAGGLPAINKPCLRNDDGSAVP
jgi:cytochrome c peroxidase